MTTSFHLHLDIQNILDLSRKEFDSSYENVFEDNGQPLSQDYVRNMLERELSLGHKKFPLGGCDNFDYEKGCLGHSEIYIENPEEIKKCLRALYDACMAADFYGELSEYIDGSLLDKSAKALGIQSAVETEGVK